MDKVFIFFICFFICVYSVHFLLSRIKYPDYNFFDWFDDSEGCEKKYDN